MIRIKELRAEKKVRQVDLAKHLGISQNTLSYWERGEYQPDNEMLTKIADYFNVSTDYLLGRCDTRRPGDVAALSSVVPYDDLPPEAIKELQQYREFLIQKYGKKKDS